MTTLVWVGRTTLTTGFLVSLPKGSRYPQTGISPNAAMKFNDTEEAKTFLSENSVWFLGTEVVLLEVKT